MKIEIFGLGNRLNVILLHALDKKLLQEVSNHPVHIKKKNGEFSTSSFIPFCSFGNDLIGSKIKGLDIPVCDIFNTKIHNDQLCYETDLQEMKDSNIEIFKKQLEMGLTFILDYNEERQIDFEHSSVKKTSAKKLRSDNDNSVSLFLNTIGR